MIRDTLAFAYAQGFIERLHGEAFGRTHETDQDWNDAYDRGRALAAWLRDSDGSGEAGETAQTGSTEGDSAGPQGIAQTSDPEAAA